ncbi:AI-2E family transporter [Dysgonomonas sp. 520]|uniref:AI-2E family transporter n=1 Tax=Dysgonomonas sp. 520 TaxID=2302931 RepID=UPI0013D6BF27|nr:AI-2E family transporter [Dysgonomonas sp. 520]NDW08529.1 AI-2E family transporter [Dysgonomonas sp. 520]
MEYRDYEKPFTFDRVVRLVISIALFAFGIYLIYILSSVLLPFLVAWLIAYLLNPVVRFFQNKIRIKNRLASVTLTFVLMIGIIIGVVVGITPLVEDEINQINQLIASYHLQTLNIEGLPVSMREFVNQYLDFNKIREAISKQQAQEAIKYLIPTVRGILSSGISVLLGATVIFIIILYLIFILLDYEKINKLWINLIPPKYRASVQKLASNVEFSMNRYFRHQALICLIVGTLFAICFQIVGLPLSILMGILIAILHMIPYMHALTIVPAAMLCWLNVAQTGGSFWAQFGVIFLIYIGIQCIIDLVLTPKIMGKAMGLNPAIILLSLSIWGSLMGIVGMIIAIPMTTLLLSYYQQFIDSMASDIEPKEKPGDKQDG